MPNITIYCFRNDLRLLDNPAFLKASTDSDILLPIFCHPNNGLIYRGIKRIGIHRQAFLRQALNQLRINLKTLNSDLIEVQGNIDNQIKKIADTIGAKKIFFEKIIAHEEREQEKLIRNLGIPVETFWQSSMIDPLELPFEPHDMPDIFTEFRRQIESKKIQVKPPSLPPSKLPPLPSKKFESAYNVEYVEGIKNEKSSFPYLRKSIPRWRKNCISSPWKLFT